MEFDSLARIANINIGNLNGSGVNSDYNSTQATPQGGWISKRDEGYTQTGGRTETPAAPAQDIKPLQFSGTSAKRDFRAGDEEFKAVVDERVVSEVDIAREIHEANKQLREMFREFKYSIHKPTNTVIVKVINSGTNEVIREIPPEKSLDALAKMWELHGLLLDKKL
ncbi:MAG: flagellar protein FlaG [Clostridiales bacterium]|jgi:flagellar protein FlaG|nr:flagellar protein FlaG [Clostridiales bacterium]